MIFIFLYFVYFAVLALMVVSNWLVFTKAGRPGWAAIIPIYNTYILLKIAGKPGWWLIGLFVPLVDLIIWILIYDGLAKNFGRGVGFTIGLIFLPFIFLPILAFGSAEYVGKAKEIKSQQEGGKAGRPARRLPLYAIVAFIVVAIVAIVVVVPIVVVVLLPASSPESGKVTVSIEAPAAVSAGGEFVATVNISGVKNFDSAVYDVTYDPMVLEVVAINGGTVNNTEVPVDMWDFIPSGEQGKVRILNNIPGTPGVSGLGYLSEIRFKVVGASGDTSGLGFVTQEVSMADNAAKDILATWVGDSITVQ